MKLRHILCFSLMAITADVVNGAEAQCIEEVEGICLKFAERPAPALSPAEKQEVALALSAANRRAVQSRLSASGYYLGPIDGVFGGETRDAIASWQLAEGLRANGFLSRPALAALLRRSEIAKATPPSAFFNSDMAALAVHGLHCRKDIAGEPAALRFHRDGSVLARASEIASSLRWSLEGKRFCVRHHGYIVDCVEIRPDATKTPLYAIRKQIERSC